VVIHDIENNGELLLMAGIDQSLQPHGPAVRALHGERIDTVVAPVAFARKLGDGHKLNGCDTQVFQLIEARYDGLKGALTGENTHVQLIDKVALKGDSRPALVVPRKTGIHYLGGAMNTVRLVSGRRIGTLLPYIEKIKIKRPGFHAFYDSTMVTSLGTMQRH
jgi:hypothetical protein